MTQVFILCAQLAAGWGCVPMATEAGCAKAEAALNRSIITGSMCEQAEMRLGSEHAPEWSPIPITKGENT